MLFGRVIDNERIEHELWMVAGPYSVMRIISDARYLAADTALQKERLKKSGKNSVQFSQGIA